MLENSSASNYNDVCKPVSVCELLRIENISPPSSQDTDTTSELLIYSPTLLTTPLPAGPITRTGIEFCSASVCVCVWGGS